MASFGARGTRTRNEQGYGERSQAGGGGSEGESICRFFRGGSCLFGQKCKFAHVQSPMPNASGTMHRVKLKPTQAIKDVMASDAYLSWKSILKDPPRHADLQTAQRLWTRGLELLRNSGKDWQQRLPRDLTDETQLNGFQHILNLLNMKDCLTKIIIC